MIEIFRECLTSVGSLEFLLVTSSLKWEFAQIEVIVIRSCRRNKGNEKHLPVTTHSCKNRFSSLAEIALGTVLELTSGMTFVLSSVLRFFFGLKTNSAVVTNGLWKATISFPVVLADNRTVLLLGFVLWFARFFTRSTILISKVFEFSLDWDIMEKISILSFHFTVFHYASIPLNKVRICSLLWLFRWLQLQHALRCVHLFKGFQ